MGCRDEPITCRKKIAARFGLVPNTKKSWQFSGECPNCGHGGFSLGAPDQPGVTLRHFWNCNCPRCHCDRADVRDAMELAGVPDACLGAFGRKPRTASQVVTEADRLRAAMGDILSDDKIRALADLKLRIAEVLWGDAPADWEGFVAFAEQAGVSRSKRYDAAARWGRQRQ